jgi:hypothetical protein
MIVAHDSSIFFSLSAEAPPLPLPSPTRGEGVIVALRATALFH